MNNHEIRNLIDSLMDKKINEVFIDVQDKLGITSGDTTPDQEMALEEVKSLLVNIITEIIKFELETNGITE